MKISRNDVIQISVATFSAGLLVPIDKFYIVFYVTFSNYFQTGLKKYFCFHIKYFTWTLFVLPVMYILCEQIKCVLWMELGLRFLLCMFVPNLLYWLRYRNTQIYKDSIRWLIERIHVSMKIRKLLLS